MPISISHFPVQPSTGDTFPQFSAFIGLTDKAVIYWIFSNAWRVDFKNTEHCLLMVYFSNFPFPIAFEFHNFSTERFHRKGNRRDSPQFVTLHFFSEQQLLPKPFAFAGSHIHLRLCSIPDQQFTKMKRCDGMYCDKLTPSQYRLSKYLYRYPHYRLPPVNKSARSAICLVSETSLLMLQKAEFPSSI